MYSFPEIKTIQYMGSKNRLLEAIYELISRPKDIHRVVDLFAGSGVVGYSLKEKYQIISNDLETYAYVINQAILNGCIMRTEEINELFRKIDSSFEIAADYINEAIQEERIFLKNGNKVYEEYAFFSDNTPSVFNDTNKLESMKSLSELVKMVNPGMVEQVVPFPCLFMTYYANAYFGIQQCCQIDAIYSAINDIKSDRQKYVLMMLAMSVMSEVATTTAHFAQFLKVKNQSTCKNIMEKRQVDIIKLFKQKVQDNLPKLLSNDKPIAHTCMNSDYVYCLREIDLDNKTVVYADPPYFKEHYSRYYHILNTFCLYDYPALAINQQRNELSVGRYRAERNVSDFGKKSKALEAFQKLIAMCAAKDTSIVLSYSNNSIVKIEDIQKLAEMYYLNVTVKHINLKHSNQGRESMSEVEEYLFLCENSREFLDPIAELSELKPIVDNPAGFMHNYMARKPYNIVSAVIDKFSPKNGVVYDPMFGSGTTIIEASKLGRNAIGTDINPVAYKLCHTSLKKWDLSKVESQVYDFVKKIKEKCDEIYIYNIYGEKRVIERCHFDLIHGEYMPTKYWFKRIEGEKISGKKFAEAEKEFVKHYNKYSRIKINNIENKVLIANSRIAIKENEKVFDYFCYRNLVALDRIIGELQDRKDLYAYAVLELIVSSAINLIKLSDKKASSQMPYWLPQKDATSRNAVYVIEKKAKSVLEGLKYLEKERMTLLDEDCLDNQKKILIKNIPAQAISDNELKKESVDLVFTDPPYTDQVPYLEYSQLWNDIMSANDDVKYVDEMVVSDAVSREKNIENYNYIFEQIIERCAASLKQDAFFIMFFHTFNLKSWNRIVIAMKKNNLEYVGQVPIASPRKSFKTVMSPKCTLDGNYILIFRKNTLLYKDNKEFTMDAAEEEVRETTRSIIGKYTFVTTQDLYDKGLLKDAIEKGYLQELAKKYVSFVDIIRGDFVCENGYWREKVCIGC